jgi:hypothetical protein
VAKARGQHGYVVFDAHMHMLLGDEALDSRISPGPGRRGERGDLYQQTFDLHDQVAVSPATPARR